MASIVIMPKQGLMMTEGTITAWLKKEGEEIAAGTPLFEMETDKLTITMDAEVSGTLLKIIHPAGDVVPITQPIAIVGTPGEDISALLGGEAPAAPEAAAPAAAPESPATPAAPAAAPAELPASASLVIMPKQGLMMTEGTIINWLVKEGEQVTAGKPLFEMETDKLTITMDAEVSGTMLKILHPAGDVVPITEPIAIVGEAGTDVSGFAGGAAPAAAPAAPVPAAAPAAAPAAPAAVPARDPNTRIWASPRARLHAEENGVDLAYVPATGPDDYIIDRDVISYLANKPAVTPLAANVAKAQGIDLSGVTGTGANGKITTADLPGAAPAAVAAPAAAPAADATLADAEAPAGQLTRGTHTEKMSGMRKAISKNMLASKSTNAQTNHRMVVDMTAAIALRKQYKDLGIKISYNDIIVRACAKALQDMPIVNASVDGSNIVYHDYVNVGTAVSVPGGLIVPVIKDADIIGLSGIAAKSTELIEKARDGKLTDADYHGGTFTVSSLGMFDLDDFVAIINPPESAILAVGKIAKTPVVVTNDEGEDEIVIKSMCALCLSYDHRIIDGAEAAKFLQKVKSYLQNPVLLI
ncbi:2-oxo acid dehydrogenase subunit E2 [Oscillibacter valericigenes]|uniref:2-oxo acid dehydrogenase subunit E2 n=1 Tax=Oscillibacter valericigenes TaxID=351091 RepID=UPI001F3C3139|nr:2-oxo acid dehydrogenase subunit E2 [Oscillibacter valericigenes]MCF2665315.1 2-oxo acid dehydrogenase subunit E2 [Oscillibacter valericigenes]